MSALSETLWNPFLVYGLLAAGLVATIATTFVQLRRLPAAVRAASNRAKPSTPSGPLSLLLASCASMGTITGATVAVTMGGPGALGWMWITTLLGLSLHFAAGALGVTRLRTNGPTGAGRESSGLLGLVFTMGTVAVAASVGGLLQSHEAAAMVSAMGGPPPPVVAVAVALAAATIAFIPPFGARFLRYGVPLAILAYAAVAMSVLAEDPLAAQLALADAVNGAFGLDDAGPGVASGAIGLAIYHGVSRSVLANEIGLSTAALASQPDQTPTRMGAIAMLAPLITAATIATLTAVLVTTESAQDIVLTEPKPLALERAYGRGLQPNRKYGQTIVLRENSGLDADSHYRMVMRANPRGHRFARLLPEQNAVLMPKWVISEPVDSVVFRPSDAGLASAPGWDVRVPCNVEDVTPPGGGDKLIKLTPTDPKIEFKRLITRFELSSVAYVNAGDYTFTGAVRQATSPSMGQILAMYEAPQPDRAYNPKLHEFVRAGYRGPYAADGRPRPPFAFVSEGTLPETTRSELLASPVVELELRTDPRGVPLGRLTRSGTFEAPPWDLLLDVKTVVIAHAHDPSQDRQIPVDAVLEDHRIRFRPKIQGWDDFRRIKNLDGFEDRPRVLLGNHRFAAEVHGSARLSPELGDRQTLVPLHPQTEPTGPTAQLPYTPHPAELLAAGWTGPYPARTQTGAALVAKRVARSAPGAQGWILAIAAAVLAMSSIAAWSEYAGRSVESRLGKGALVVRVLVVVSAAGGALASLEGLLPWVDVALALMLAASLLVMAPKLALIRQLSKSSVD